jgi:hypothetical protein
MVTVTSPITQSGEKGFLVKHRLFISLPGKVGCFYCRNLIATQWTKLNLAAKPQGTV